MSLAAICLRGLNGANALVLWVLTREPDLGLVCGDGLPDLFVRVNVFHGSPTAGPHQGRCQSSAAFVQRSGGLEAGHAQDSVGMNVGGEANDKAHARTGN